MSNFYCEHCGAEILEGEGGYYVTGCEHYPLELSGIDSRPELTNGGTPGMIKLYSDEEKPLGLKFYEEKQPQDLLTRLRALEENYMEQIAAEVHKQWWREKEKQGFHPPTHCQYWPLPHGEEESRDAAFSKHCEKCHADMYPYNELPEHVKEYDRVTVKGVLSAIEEIAAEIEKEE